MTDNHPTNIEAGPYSTKQAALDYAYTFKGAKRIRAEKKSDGWWVNFKWGGTK